MPSGAKACKSCRSREELSNEYFLAKFGFDTAENEPCKVCPLSAYRSDHYYFLLQIPQVEGGITQCGRGDLAGSSCAKGKMRAL